MFMTPGAVVLGWIRGLLAILVVVGAVWLLSTWYKRLPETEVKHVTGDQQRQTADDRVTGNGAVAVIERKLSPVERISSFRPGMDRETAMLLGGVFLVLWTFAGRFLRVSLWFSKTGEKKPQLPPGSVQRLSQLNGAELHVESRGPTDAPTVILTHGWSLSGEEWAYLQQHWGDRFRTVVWDLPGLGKSTQPTNRDFSLENLARSLRTVIDGASTGPVILVGHSIGGMIILTFCKLFPELIGSRVTKLVLIHTTYTNPLRTMMLSGLATALQKPLIEPLLYLQIALSLLVRVLNLMSYWNGSIHSSARQNGFAGTQSRSQVDFVASYYPVDSPAVLARGALGMLGYDATTALASINVPVFVIGAQEDPITLVQASQTIQASVPQGDLWTLQPAKHFGLIEYHKEVAERIATFCKAATTV